MHVTFFSNVAHSSMHNANLVMTNFPVLKKLLLTFYIRLTNLTNCMAEWAFNGICYSIICVISYFSGS